MTTLKRNVNISREEEKEIFNNYTPSNREKIIESYIPLIKMIIKKKFANYPEEELLSFGLEKLVIYTDNFYNSKEEDFYWYIYKKIIRGINFYLKSKTQENEKTVELSKEILDNNDPNDVIDKVYDSLSLNAIKEYISHLNDLDYKIYYMYYGLGYSTNKISKILKIKEHTLTVRRIKIINRIRVYLYKCGLIDEKDLTIDEKKMARIFKAPKYEEVMPSYMLSKKHPSNHIIEFKDYLKETIRNDNLDDISKYFSTNDLNNLFNILKSNTYRGVFGYLSTQDIFIICLKFGFVNGKYYTSENIALFLNIEIEKVNSLIRDVILNYKNLLVAKEQNYLLERKNFK